MGKAEIFEEIRTRLKEPQQEIGAEVWRYDDVELIRQVRSSLRTLRALGVNTDAVMSEEGVLDPSPTDNVGMLIALDVCQRLLSGDLTQKLLDGEIGTYFRVGPDIIDTKTAMTAFQKHGQRLVDEFERLLVMVLADTNDGTAFFGEPTTRGG